MSSFLLQTDGGIADAACDRFDGGRQAVQNFRDELLCRRPFSRGKAFQCYSPLLHTLWPRKELVAPLGLEGTQELAKFGSFVLATPKVLCSGGCGEPLMDMCLPHMVYLIILVLETYCRVGALLRLRSKCLMKAVQSRWWALLANPGEHLRPSKTGTYDVSFHFEQPLIQYHSGHYLLKTQKKRSGGSPFRLRLYRSLRGLQTAMERLGRRKATLR